MTNELRNKTSEELCILILRLKLQLLESRFLQQNGTLEKPHTLPEIRKTIARALTVLTERSIDLSIGTHGITMYDRKNNTVKSINEDAAKVIQKTEKETNSEDLSVKQVVVDTTKKTKKVVASTKAPAVEPIAVKAVKNEKAKSQTRTKAQVIRKSVGGK